MTLVMANKSYSLEQCKIDFWNWTLFSFFLHMVARSRAPKVDICAGANRFWLNLSSAEKIIIFCRELQKCGRESFGTESSKNTIDFRKYSKPYHPKDARNSIKSDKFSSCIFFGAHLGYNCQPSHQTFIVTKVFHNSFFVKDHDDFRTRFLMSFLFSDSKRR